MTVLANHARISKENQRLREGLRRVAGLCQETIRVVEDLLRADNRGPHEVFSRSTEELGLSVRCFNALCNAGIWTIGGLVSQTEAYLFGQPKDTSGARYLGRKSFDEVKGALDKLGLRFGMTEEDIRNWAPPEA